MNKELKYIIPILFSFLLIFNYKQANKIFDKFFRIKRKNKKNKKVNYKYFVYLVPILLLIYLDYTARKDPSSLKTSNENSLLEETGLYKIIPEPNPIKLKNKVIILIDDLINSGATLMYSINKLLDYSPKEIQIAVLIERNYKSFPLTPDFKGLELSTAKSEHVEVSIDKSPKVLIK